MLNKQAKTGFTLIELLVVVLIIGILASVALPQYQLAVEKSRAAKVWPVLRAINEAEKRKNLEEGTQSVTYPISQLDIGFDNITTSNEGTVMDYITTSDFRIGLATRYYSANDILTEEPAAAHRVGGSSDYLLSLRNGKKACAGGDICKKIVGTRTGVAWQDCLTGGNCFTE